MKIIIQTDSDGYLIKLDGYDNIYAWGETVYQALEEFKNVLEMFLEEEPQKYSFLKPILLSLTNNYAL